MSRPEPEAAAISKLLAAKQVKLPLRSVAGGTKLGTS